MSIPADCENLPGAVPLPRPRDGQDMRNIAAENRAGLVTVNKRVAKKDSCMATVRKSFQ